MSGSDISIEALVQQRVEAAKTAAREAEKKGAPGDASGSGGNGGGEVTRKFVNDCLHANQLGDGMLYAALLDGKFVQNMKTEEWLAWAGNFWELDVMKKSLSSADVVARRYLQEARDLVEDIGNAKKNGNEEIAKSFQKQQHNIYRRVTRLRSEGGRANCRSFAAINENHPLAITGENLDQDPWLFACKNGVIDLRTGELRPGRKDDWITKASPIEYPGIEACPTTWVNALLSIFDGRQDLVDFLQRLLGYAITGLKSENILPVFWGGGANGKTTIVEIVSHILGPMAAPIQSEMLLDQGRSKSASSASPDIMALKGLRIAFGSESDEGRRFSPAKVKWLSGSDTLVGRSPYDRYDTYFTPTHSLILITNHKPHAPANDFAFWRRVLLIPFTLSFVDVPERDHERPADKSLPDQLKEEAPAILSWLVQGCLKWQRDGLAPPKSIVDATEEYKREEDLLADFLDEKCHIDPKSEIPATDLYDAFKEWFSENVSKRSQFSQKKFGKLMKDREEFEKVKRGTYFYKGLRLMIGLDSGR